MAADLNTILDNADMNPPPPVSRETLDKFVPRKYQTNADSIEQIKQDFRKAIADLESRFKSLIEDMKRAAG